MSKRTENPEKILVVATNWVGDAVMNLPFLEALKERYPESSIHITCRPWVADVFRHQREVDGLYVQEDKAFAAQRRLARQIKADGFQVAYVLPNSFRSALLPFLARIPHRIGYQADWRRGLLTRAIPLDARKARQHEIFHYLNLLGVSEQGTRDRSPKLHVTREEEEWADDFLREHAAPGRTCFGLNPGATFGTAKRWTEEGFIEVGRWLASSQRRQVLLFGSPAEEELARRIGDRIGPEAVVTAGKTTLRQAAALLARCECLVTNDTGTMHVAAAVGTRVVAIFGSTNPLTTYPYGDGHIMVREPVACSPCMLRDCPIDHRCMTRITPDRILEHLSP